MYYFPEKYDNMSDADVLADVAAHTYLEEMNGFELDDNSSDLSDYENV